MEKNQREPRVNVSVRISRSGIEAVRALADVEQRTWSEMLRLVLADGIEARNRKANR